MTTKRMAHADIEHAQALLTAEDWEEFARLYGARLIADLARAKALLVAAVVEKP